MLQIYVEIYIETFDPIHCSHLHVAGIEHTKFYGKES